MPYASTLGIGALIGMGPVGMATILAKKFVTKYGAKALKGLYSQVTGGGGKEEPYEPGYGVRGTPESESTMGTPSIGMEGVPTPEEQAAAGTAYGPIGPKGFGVGTMGVGDGRDEASGGMGGRSFGGDEGPEAGMGETGESAW